MPNADVAAEAELRLGRLIVRRLRLDEMLEVGEDAGNIEEAVDRVE